jgi:hypothetical protein
MFEIYVSISFLKLFAIVLTAKAPATAAGVASAVLVSAATCAAAGVLTVLTYEMVSKEIRNRRVRREKKGEHYRIIIMNKATMKILEELVACTLDPEMLRLFPKDGDWIVT